MATSAATVLKIIESMVDARPKTVDAAIELLNGEGLLPAKLLTDRAKALVAADTPSKVDSRFASPYAQSFAIQNRIRIPEGFVGTGRDGTIKKPDLERLLAGVTVKDPKVPKAAKAPKAPKVPKASKITKKVRELLHDWGLDESALEGIQPTAYNGAKYGVGDIAHLEPGLETGKTKKSPVKGKDKAPPSEGASSSSSRAAPPVEDDASDESSDTTEEQDDDEEEEDFDPFKAFDKD
jgi:pyruvate/2-oxoglutarate dehydrogenase complex dihydrolipoamide acyltransferase (E2) component